MEFKYDDGGRVEAGYKGQAGDCTVRAIAIATGKLYQEVYAEINLLAKSERVTKGKSSARNGVRIATTRKYLKSLGWQWVPTMQIGSGCKVHLKADELPSGRLIVRVSKHITTVIDGVIHDTYNPQRNTIVVENDIKRIARRCVYGYWIAEE